MNLEEPKELPRYYTLFFYLFHKAERHALNSFIIGKYENLYLITNGSGNKNFKPYSLSYFQKKLRAEWKPNRLEKPLFKFKGKYYKNIITAIDYLIRYKKNDLFQIRTFKYKGTNLELSINQKKSLALRQVNRKQNSVIFDLNAFLSSDKKDKLKESASPFNYLHLYLEIPQFKQSYSIVTKQKDFSEEYELDEVCPRCQKQIKKVKKEDLLFYQCKCKYIDKRYYHPNYIVKKVRQYTEEYLNKILRKVGETEDLYKLNSKFERIDNFIIPPKLFLADKSYKAQFIQNHFPDEVHSRKMLQSTIDGKKRSIKRKYNDGPKNFLDTLTIDYCPHCKRILKNHNNKLICKCGFNFSCSIKLFEKKNLYYYLKEKWTNMDLLNLLSRYTRKKYLKNSEKSKLIREILRSYSNFYGSKIPKNPYVKQGLFSEQNFFKTEFSKLFKKKEQKIILKEFKQEFKSSLQHIRQYLPLFLKFKQKYNEKDISFVKFIDVYTSGDIPELWPIFDKLGADVFKDCYNSNDFEGPFSFEDLCLYYKYLDKEKIYHFFEHKILDKERIKLKSDKIKEDEIIRSTPKEESTQIKKINPPETQSQDEKINLKSKKLHVKTIKPSQELNTKNQVFINAKNEKLNIGRWGEKQILHILNSKIKNEDCEVKWLNQEGETYQDHDIEIIKRDTTIYIEVKTTINSEKTFSISQNEFELAKKKKENYIIYHILNANGKPKYYKIENFYKKYQNSHFKVKSRKLTYNLLK